MNFKDEQKLLALFRWNRSHAIEYIRGSAAIAEWFEQILAMTAGYTLKRENGWIDSSKAV